MTMLPTAYSMCDQDNDLMARSNEHEFVERTNASPLLDFCLDGLTHRERDALESELNLAACLQQALLPRHDSSDHGWQICYHYAPAGLLSGDYCDFFESNSGLFFLLGDVSGKGVAASLPRGFPSECLTAFDFRLAASRLILETCCCCTRMD
jgi:hypothetical protein